MLQQQSPETGSPVLLDLSNVLPRPALLSSRALAWHGLIVELCRNVPCDIDEHCYDDHLITLHLGQPLKLVQKQDGYLHEGTIVKGDITIIPRGQSKGWRHAGVAEVLYLRLQPSFVRQVAGEMSDALPEHWELRHVLNTRDPLIEQIGLACLKELRTGGIGGRLFAESLAHALAVHILRQYSSLAPPTHAGAGGLSKHKLRRALEYIDAHLARDLTLAEIADALGMSPYYFARSFKRSIGLAPHQYLLNRRTERAKTLLAKTDLSIVEICHRVGFQSQSHFTTLFRKHTSMTPKSFREKL